MATTIILAVFIASATTFEVGVAEDSAFRHAAFPNSAQGLEQMGKWIETSGVTEFDRVCISGPVKETTPAYRFWSTRKVPVDLMSYERVRAYLGAHKDARPSAETVAKACIEPPQKGSVPARRK